MQIKKICILGGSGFVGKTLANRLVAGGYQLRVLTRNREEHRDDLILLPDLELIETNIHQERQLAGHLAGCDAVINLTGILNESGTNGAGFHAVHVALIEKILRACGEHGIKRLLQMSALNADARNGPSHYLRTKGMAEDLAHAAADLHVTSFRPSVIFGPADSFFNRFAHLLKLLPVVFPLACPKARFAPVYVGDVAEACARALTDPATYGKRFDLCGPRVYTLQELVEYTAQCAGIKRIIIPLPDFVSRLQAGWFDMMGFAFRAINMDKPFSMDNYLSAQLDSISAHNGLITLGVTPTALESIVPRYLGKRDQRARYDDFRRTSRRSL